MIAAHLPALQVVMALVASPLCVLLRRGGTSWLLATLTAWASLAAAVFLLRRVLAEGTVYYAFGGWAAPWGIEYRIDVLSAFVLLIIAGIGAVVLPYARRSVEAEIVPERRHLFYALVMLLLAGRPRPGGRGGERR